MKHLRSLPAWRSLLFVPVTNDKFVDTAHTRGADALILDLEDSVATARKDEARSRLSAAAETVARGGADVLVRINRPWRLAFRDLEAAVSPRIHALLLPKVENAHHVTVVSEVVGELERERGMAVGTTKLIALVETAEAYPHMLDIANADARVIAMTLGAEDFSASCGMVPDDDGLYVPKMQMLVCAKAAGVIALGFVGTVADYKDLDGLRKAAQRARRLGFMASTCIHPAQVPIVNAAYSPSDKEVAHARRVVEAAAAAAIAGVGAYEVDGKMIDFPVVERARKLLAQHEAATRPRAP
jgi:citrate lyase subunit beta/citryl-CoA lyase